MKDGQIQHLFQDAVERYRDAAAISQTGHRTTYGELGAEAGRLASFLREAGARKGSPVALLLPGARRVIPSMIGVLQAGCAFVPLDPGAPPARLRAMLAQASPEWLVCEAATLPLAERLAAEPGPAAPAARIVCLDAEPAEAGSRGLRGFTAWSGEAPPIDAGPDDLCYVFFTSGSTGTPKGIAGRLKGIDHFVRWEARTFGLGEGTRVSQLTAPTFDAILRDVFVPLSIGGTICLPESREAVLDPAALVRWLDGEEVHLLHCVPSVFRALLNEPLEPGLFPALRHVLLAGEPLLPADVRRWMDVFGERVELVNLYGPSETTMVKLFHRVRPEDARRSSIPLGKPMDGARAVVVDEAGEICPPGIAGEIWIRTPYRSLGYYNQPELTRQAFIPNPFGSNPNDLVYKTGDLGRLLDDGDLEFLGRRDGQVKIRGVRVELAEIESLLRDHPAVRDVAVVDREDAAGNPRLCAYLVTEGELDAALRERLRERLREQLSEVMVPGVFARLEALPRTATGKVDRRALPAPDEGIDAAAEAAPRSPVEEVLAAFWTRILNVPRAGVHDSFFALGGHSLLATQLLSRIRAAFGVELSLRVVFDRPTIAQIARAVEEELRARSRTPAPPLVPVPRDRALPLSFAQQRLWFLDQLAPGSPAYNLATVIRLRGALDVDLLGRALSAVVARHEALRTRFALAGGSPVQVIAPPAPVDLPVTDLRELPAEEREAEARRAAEAEAHRPFDLERDPLVRVRLFRLGDEEHLATFVVHHIVSDDWSMGLLVRELTALYAAFREGRPSPLPAPALQYADFAAWQRAWLQGEVLEEQLGWWRERLAGAPPVLDLPTDRPRLPMQSLRGARQTVTLPGDLAEELRALSRDEGSTLFMALLAGWATLLHRYSGQDDLVVGSPVANRHRAEVEEMMGFFVNTLALRSDLEGDPPFRRLLGQVRETALGAYVHQDLPFEKIVEELQPVRDRAHGPIFQVLFVLQNASGAHLELPGLALEPVEIPRHTARLDLGLALAEAPQGIAGPLEYNRDLFDEATVRRLAGHFEVLLRGIAADPSRPVSELPLLTVEERRQLLVQWNDTAREWPDDLPVHALFAARARQRPDDPAALDEGGTATYAELDRRANRLAHRLRALGVGPESRVGLLAERSVEAVAGILGILKAGGCYVPLDPDHPADRLAAMLRDAGAGVLVTQERLASRLPGTGGPVVRLDGVGIEPGIEAGSPEPPAVAVDGDHPAYVIYTSGSTGTPKGVVVRHRALANFARSLAEAVGLAPGDRMLEFASLGFDASALQIFPTLISGAALVLHPHPGRLAPAEIAALCERQGVTVLDLPAALWRHWIDEMQGHRERILPGVRAFLTGGESFPADKLRQWALLPAGDARLFSSYGPTEGTVTTTFCGIGLDEVARFAREKLPLGRPLPNLRVYVLDAARRPVPLGVPGELYLGGEGLARGYQGRPDLTAEAFVPFPDSGMPGERLYRTGDLVRHLPDGQLEFLGRADHQVKIRGFRVEPGEVEAALSAHPAVRQCAVVVHEERPGDPRLAAYPVFAGEPATAAELRMFLAGRLPEHMIPASFTPLDRLPVLPSGKLDRRALPAPVRPEAGTGLKPGNAVEEVLAGIWTEALGIQGIGIEDDFFALGGHSLLAARVVGQVRDVFQVDLELRRLFEAPTIGSLAALLLDDPGQRPRIERTAEVLLAVDRLSDEEMEAWLEDDLVTYEEEAR